MRTERVVEHLNGALHTLFATDDRLYLLGEDVLDPYGGAFKATRGLSTRYPDRVLATPLSENGIVGVANGLALAGNRVVVEIMFADFIGLAVDQLTNFAATSVAMYGRPVPMPVVVRCPTGGHRGYGPTHSQSPQKHFIGVPHLSVWEISPFHDIAVVLGTMLGRSEPGVLFEDKVLYTQRMFRDGVVDADYRFEALPGPGHWVRVHRPDAVNAQVALVVPGGMVRHALTAVREVYEAGSVVVDLFVPAQLYPVDLDPVAASLAAAGRVCVAEESTAGGTWGSELSAQIHTRLWADLSAPVHLVHSRPSVIPAAPHLERTVLVQPADIRDALLHLSHGSGSARGRPRAAGAPPAVGVAATGAAGERHPVLLPTFNANDTSATLLTWLVEDGGQVSAGTAVAEVETAKAVNEIEADRGGVLHHIRRAGEECGFGEAIAYVDTGGDHAPSSLTSAMDRDGGAHDAGRRADRVQAAVAAAVTRALTIPAAFTAARVELDAALALLDLLSADGAVLDLPSLIVRAIALLRQDFPDLYGHMGTDGTFQPATGTHIAVTMDAGAGLFLPVVRDADRRGIDEIADELVGFRLNAVEGRFADEQLSGAAITVSLNIVEGITVVQPLIMPPQVCMISVGGLESQLRPGADGSPTVVRATTVGVAYDHRVVNGSAATRFLTALRDLLARPDPWA